MSLYLQDWRDGLWKTWMCRLRRWCVYLGVISYLTCIGAIPSYAISNTRECSPGYVAHIFRPPAGNWVAGMLFRAVGENCHLSGGTRGWQPPTWLRLHNAMSCDDCTAEVTHQKRTSRKVATGVDKVIDNLKFYLREAGSLRRPLPKLTCVVVELRG